MTQGKKHIQRGTDVVLGGVCSGIAAYFDFDTMLIRILVVVLTGITAGAFGVVYLALWLILPNAPRESTTMDVHADSCKSEIYEQVVNGVHAAGSSVVQVSPSIPPVPPAAASAYYSAGSRVSYSTAQMASSKPSKTYKTQHRFVLTGASLGILLIVLGCIVLACAFGVTTVDTVAWLSHSGPLLLVAVGLFIMGRASKSNILILCAAAALVLFVVVGAYFSLRDGPVELGVSLPFSPESILLEQGN